MFSRSCVELATYIFEKMEYDYAKIVKDIPHKQVGKWRKYSKKRQERALYSYILGATSFENLASVLKLYFCNLRNSFS